MCQLNFSNLHDNQLNGMYYLFQSWENSVLNKDGFGLYCDNYLLKSKLQMLNCTNVGTLLYENYTTDNPILSHTRAATEGGNNKKNIDDESAHPFEGKYFILAHNGRLELKVNNNIYKNTPVDSLVFLSELEKKYEKDKDIAKCISETMALFYGTFAFLIYCKETKEYFAVRGKTKLLYTSNLNRNKENLGYVINTSSIDIDDALIKCMNMYQFITGLNFTYEKPVLLEEESIFLLTDDIKKIGTVKENYKPVYVYNDENDVLRGFKNEYKLSMDLFSPFYSFLTELSLDIFELDLMLYKNVNRGLTELSEKDAEFCIKYLFPKYRGYFTKAKHTVWLEIKALCKGKSIPNTLNCLYPYYQYNLQFPYMMNSKNDLIRALNKAKVENEKVDIVQ